MKLHFVGIKGSGVAGVARLAEKMGYEVDGCDMFLNGHNINHLKGVDMVIVTPAVFYQSAKDPEIVEAKKRKILITWQEFVGKYLLKDKKVIAVAGTHGKSTTTAMLGKLLIDSGLDPVVILGANVRQWSGSSRFGKGEYAVIEADEFNNNFLNYSPDFIILNNIEFDHPDFFKSEREIRESFKKFTDKLKDKNNLITQKNSLGRKFNLKIFGDHNQKNANMVFVLGKKLGLKEGDIVKSIESFTGIDRRMELIADRNGVKVYDDYAHHPTAIKTTLEGLRKVYPKEKILAVIEPHGYKRTKVLLSKYKGVFDSVDKVIIGPIFKARDEVDKTITSEKVAGASGHENISSVKEFKGVAGGFDVIVVMGAGESSKWAHVIAERLPVKFSDLTTFRIGGEIERYFEVSEEFELPGVVGKLKELGLPIFILGGGSDILVSDSPYGGVVVTYKGNELKVDRENATAGAGMIWDELVAKTVEMGLTGMECLSGIPGTVGGAPIQNVGAYGQELKDTFVSLRAFDIKNEKFVNFKNKGCNFTYRSSIFKDKSHWQRYIITSVTFKLKKNGKTEVRYDSLKSYLKKNEITNPLPSDIRQAVLNIRAGKFENPEKVGNAGSFFKNPVIPEKEFEVLEKKYPDVKYFKQDDGLYKIFAGWLIEKAGWKGRIYKSTGVSKNHALIIINRTGKAKAKDVVELSKKIIDDVKSKFGIILEREVQLINF